MIDCTDYWEKLAPYWSYCEDNFLDLESIDELTSLIESPVLIIGAGQGLLVEQLQKRGLKVDGIELSPTMIRFAKERRGIDLIEANAKQMPFDNRSYRTSIIATGVVDFMDDEEQIGLILKETLRVTEDPQGVLVAFFKFHPQVEKLFQYTGQLTDSGLWDMKRTNELTRLSPLQSLFAIKKDANISLFKAFLMVIRTQMFLPRKEKKAFKNMIEMWQHVIKNPDELIELIPDEVPYRKETQIRDLFNKLGISIRNMYSYYSCTIVVPSNIIKEF